jgi:mono/diheme cytochrome c family protein
LVGFTFGALLMLLIGGVAWWSLGSARLLGHGPPPELTATERRGETIYITSCASCHGGRDGGTMMDYPPRHNANGHTWHHPDCELTEIVREGGDPMTEAMREMMAPPDAPRMQAFKDRLPPEEIAAVLAYIKTMWTPDERAAQADVTRQACPTARL